MATYITEDVESYSERELTGKYILGHEYTDRTGSIYRFFRLVDAVTAKPGWVAEWASTTLNNVTVDRVGGSALGGHIAAGVSMGTVRPASPYAFWLVRGLTDKIVNDTGASGAGIRMAPSATQDGAATPGSVYTQHFIGTTRGVPAGAAFRQLVDVEL